MNKFALSPRLVARAAKKAQGIAANPATSTVKKIKASKQYSKFKDYAAKKFARQSNMERLLTGEKLSNKTWKEWIAGLPTFREITAQIPISMPKRLKALGFRKKAESFFDTKPVMGKSTFPLNLDQRTKAFPKVKSSSAPSSSPIRTPSISVSGIHSKAGI